jgi:hypothetical protein
MKYRRKWRKLAAIMNNEKPGDNGMKWHQQITASRRR